MINKNQIAGAVVLYNPDIDVIDNIRTYIDQIDVLFAVDNSDKPDSGLVEQIRKFPNLQYIWNGGNIGLAKALNIGAFKAIESGYTYLLTMDQDSKATTDMISKLLACMEHYDTAVIGIVAPFHVTKTETPPAELDCVEVLTVMTSGNLLNLAIFKTIGPFMEELFIDYVDHEYCLRLHQRGYKVVQSYKSLLYHNLGNITVHTFLSLTLASTNHSAFRQYFMTRNRFYLMHKYNKIYPQYCKVQFRDFIRNLICIALFERNKIDKIGRILTGYLDYNRGFGRLEERSLSSRNR